MPAPPGAVPNAKFKGVVEPRGYKKHREIHDTWSSAWIDAAFNEEPPAEDFMKDDAGKDFASRPAYDEEPIFGRGPAHMSARTKRAPRQGQRAIRAVYATATFDKISAKMAPRHKPPTPTSTGSSLSAGACCGPQPHQ